MDQYPEQTTKDLVLYTRQRKMERVYFGPGSYYTFSYWEWTC